MDKKSSHIRNQQGTTLIEILIATVVFSVAILGNMALQTYSTRNLIQVGEYQKGFLIQYIVINKIRADRTRALQGYYVYNSDSSNLPEFEDQKIDIGEGQIVVTWNGSFVYTVTVNYKDRNHVTSITI